jgi:DNA recombination protein RmuC
MIVTLEFCAGVLLLVVTFWALLLKRRLRQLLQENYAQAQEVQRARFAQEKAELELSHTKNHYNEKFDFLNQTHEMLETQIKGLCTDVLQQSNQTFLSQAQGLLDQFHLMARGEFGQQHEKLNYLMTPLAQALGVMDEKIQVLEKVRVGAYESLMQQIQGLSQNHKDLYQQTHQLVRALGTPHIRGRWGEIQLKRLVELAGMIPHCEFEEQKNLKNKEENRSFRPDLVVHLPGGKNIVIDAKVPLFSYMEGLEATDNLLQKKYLKDHAQQMRHHIKTLSQKAYWSQLKNSPEFVLLFLPSENLLTAALEEDREILDYGAESRVLIATPMTLLALLKTIALGWHNYSLTENAEKISTLGRDLYRRLNGLMSLFSKVGQHMGLAVSHYNATVSHLEEKVAPHAQELGRLTQAGASLEEAVSLPSLLRVAPKTKPSLKDLFLEEKDEALQ